MAKILSNHSDKKNKKERNMNKLERKRSCKRIKEHKLIQKRDWNEELKVIVREETNIYIYIYIYI